MALVTFALTLFVSAFLLFLVQPMIGKLILPRLGGTPQVWNTCMVFFQMVLLAGYFYTHAIGSWLKLPLRRQLLIHGILLFVPLAILLVGPFDITGWTPPPGQNPIFSTLLLLLKIVGIPFFVVSTSAPLLQKWFAHTGDPSAKDPYFLYGASNLGSLLSLVAYPFLVEPTFLLNSQAWLWTFGYIALAGLILYSASLVWTSKAQAEPAVAPAGAGSAETGIQPAAALATAAPAATAIQTGKRRMLKPSTPTSSSTAPPVSVAKPLDDTMTWARRIRWILLAAAPSSLMLGVTSYVSTDLSPFPLLWAIPLALYLITFILVFMKRWTEEPHQAVLYIQPILLATMTYFVAARNFTGNPFWATVFSFGGFFVATLACHGELAKDRPSPRHLTEFFLWMSFGGMLGGMFNAMFAPLLFTGVAEYPIAIILCAALRPRLSQSGWIDGLFLSSPQSEASMIRTSNGFSLSWHNFMNGIRRSLGMQQREFVPPNTPWVLNVSLDILLAGLFTLVLWFVKRNVANWNWYRLDPEENGLLSFLKTLGFAAGTRDEMSETVQLGVRLVLFIIPLAFCVGFMARNLRFALALAGLMLVHLYLTDRGEERIRFATRSYFGVLKVLEEKDEIFGVSEKTGAPAPRAIEALDFQKQPEVAAKLSEYAKEFNKIVRAPADERDRREAIEKLQKDYDGVINARYTYLMHGTTYHGRNYIDPPEFPKIKLSRIATTYYHRYGPVGAVMERFNYFKGAQNTFHTDARIPAAITAMMGSMQGGLPLDAVAQAWSDAPIATIGLGSGTMASYCRPFGHIAYYEIDENIRNFSLPPSGREAYFTYLLNARKRGGLVEVIMGDARLSIEREAAREKERETKKSFNEEFGDFNVTAMREGYYKVMVVDAFSSDAIPIHLLTKEAVNLYMEKLANDGVLCLHTSNRHMDLILPISEIVYDHNQAHPSDLWYVSIGQDNGKSASLGHFGSEYVMVSRVKELVDGPSLSKAVDGSEVTWTNQTATRPARRRNDREQWYPPANPGRNLWTDSYSNIIRILR
ncbi:MAG: hypothetical protein K2X38_05325 [Gemmataceae bacterium]|nr:hypothetical protein [Gemmataceae bacterium]